MAHDPAHYWADHGRNGRQARAALPKILGRLGDIRVPGEVT